MRRGAGEVAFARRQGIACGQLRPHRGRPGRRHLCAPRVSTWSGDVEDTSVHELRLNGQRLASRFGEFHNYDHDAIEVPLRRLKVGRNELTLFSTFMGHMFEINWPGPVLLIEYKK
jgi:hypothetical protein